MRYFEDIELDQVRESRPYLLEKDEIISFARQWDPQPFHIDEEAARATPLGLIASATHTFAISARLAGEVAQRGLALIAGLGWNDMKLRHPARPGDRLHVRTWVAARRVSHSRPGCGIAEAIVELRNQHDALVLSYRLATLVQRRDGADPV